MQINRLFEIVYLLLDKQQLTAAELAKYFEVSKRTIYRDIDTLSGAGIPVYMSKGRGGGISLLPEFVLNKAVLSDEERENIISSIKAVNAIDLSRKAKIVNLLGENNTDWIEVDFTDWSNSQEEKEIFNTIKSSILNKNSLQFYYVSAKGEKTIRVVHPARLCFKSQSWYLYGYCTKRNDYRFFKLRRIKNLVKLDETFTTEMPNRILTMQDPFNDGAVEIKLKFSPEAAYRVYDEFSNYLQLEDGSFIVNISMPKGHWINSYITSFGASCEVLEPKYMREAIVKEAQNILKNYL